MLDTPDRLADLHAHHGPATLRFLIRLCGGAVDQAEDLLQETMVRAWRRIDWVPEDSDAARRWFYTVARHVAVDAVRRRRTRPAEVPLQDNMSVTRTDDTADKALATDTVRRAFTRLDDRHRAVLLELHLEGRTIDEVARRLAVAPGTVRSRAHYAMQALRADLARTA
ncbi:sigma-70 family RNA polymerase sigma factor [Actinoplanes sp. NPDC051494]|uniref:sigma-70 family RNA polymerase sigma factor n=1 Tax=Actinoplanes sp. NPDC051494 TaxID=3363907 RepID=UPI003799BB94